MDARVAKPFIEQIGSSMTTLESLLKKKLVEKQGGDEEIKHTFEMMCSWKAKWDLQWTQLYTWAPARYSLKIRPMLVTVNFDEADVENQLTNIQ